MALVFILLSSCSAFADGLHCTVLDGDDLEEAWRRLVRETWPESADGVAPRVSSHKSRPLVEMAIRELLAVLQFVDEYNYADDSPAWMSTEEGRAEAREQARKILIELGRGAAPFVWQALEAELRFAHPDAKVRQEQMVKPFREAQFALREAQSLLEGERRQDKDYLQAWQRYLLLRPIVRQLEYLEKALAGARRRKVAARGKPELEAQLDKELAALEARAAKLGELRELGAKLKDAQKALEARRKVIDAEPKVAELKAAAEAAKEKLMQAMRDAGGLGQGLLPGGDPAMVSHEEWVDELKRLIAAMGPEALPEVRRGLASANLPLRAQAEGFLKGWESGERAAEFAVAAASGNHQVALAGRWLLKERLKLQSVEPLLAAAEKAQGDERKAVFEGLRLATHQEELGENLQAWKDWWAKTKKSATPGTILIDE